MPNLKCKICGAEFPISKENHRIACDFSKSGLAASLSTSNESALYDVYDCPACGCQVMAQMRKPLTDEGQNVDELTIEDFSNEELADHLGIDANVVGQLRAKASCEASRAQKSKTYSDELIWRMYNLFDFSDSDVAALLNTPLARVQKAIRKGRLGAFIEPPEHSLRVLVSAEGVTDGAAKLVDNSVIIGPDTHTVLIDLKEAIGKEWHGYLLNTKSCRAFTFGEGSK